MFLLPTITIMLSSMSHIATKTTFKLINRCTKRLMFIAVSIVKVPHVRYEVIEIYSIQNINEICTCSLPIHQNSGTLSFYGQRIFLVNNIIG
jgi:hypothetical protein